MKQARSAAGFGIMGSMDKTTYKDVDDYIAQASPKAQPLLRHIRAIINKEAPQAEESISYGMPAYKYLGRPLVYFGGFKQHVSLFAAGSQLVATTFADELKGYIQSKGTIQFPLETPLPKNLIAKIVRFRVKENETKYGQK